jgi:MOSC domain-containing protein YiiM
LAPSFPSSPTARLISIQTGRIAPLQRNDPDAPRVMSAIEKTPVSTLADPRAIRAGRLGLDGDEQSDLTVHGGIDKAVYAYPSEHYPFWNAHRHAADPAAPELLPGALGENLTLEGLRETDVFVGDILEIGECRFVVVSPRQPCEKLNCHLGSRTAGKVMVQNGLTGWYLSVASEGVIRAGDAVQLLPGPRTLSLVERQRQVFRRVDVL